MANLIVPIDLGNNKTGAVSVSPDVADYFNIAAPTATTGGMVEKAAAPYRRKVYKNIADTVGNEITVNPGARRVRPPKAASRSGGKAIKVPTEVTIARTVRRAGANVTVNYTKHVTIRFPAGASMAAISKWLFEKCRARKPGYFISPAGARYSVVNDAGVADINPGPPPLTGSTA